MTTSAASSPGTSGFGIFDDFEPYKTVTDDELRTAIQNALVVVDTNVLLNLYRYNKQTRESLVEVFAALGARLWIPRQVIEEFWRNRERALTAPVQEVRHDVAELQKRLDGVREILRAWVNRGALAQDRSAYLEHNVAAAFEEIEGTISNLVEERAANAARNTNSDPVLALLEPVLAGRVGGPMPPNDYESAIKEGKRRASAGEPPGFADAKKASRDEEGAAGDYLVWEQLLREAESRSSDVVFVTGDVKKDWWRYEGSFPRGPRIELCRELRARCGRALYMLRPDSLLTLADALAVSVNIESVEDVERTSRDQIDPPGAGADESDSGTWTRRAVESVLKLLSIQAPVQEATIRLAVTNGGFVSREEVYELGEYEPERQLKGFTRPVNRLVQELRELGLVDEAAPDLLAPVYEDMSYGFGRVDGFRVPADVVALLRE